MVKFYNAADQKLYEQYKFLPQEQYRLGLNLPTSDPVVDEGIVNTNAFANSGGNDGFSVYNPDPNTISNSNYIPNYDYRQALEKSFVGATDPKYFNQSFDPSGAVADAQQKYNEFQTAPYRMGIDTPVGQRQAKYESDANEIIMDNKERYRTKGQYETVPSKFSYDTETEAQKMMDMNQNYYNKPPPSKLQGLMSMIPGAGIARFLGNQIGGMLPTNRRAIMENELGGRGVMVNDIGQIVQGEGDYNTAENIMAGYNANKITQETINKRQGTIEKTLANKYNMSPKDIAAVKAGTYTGPVKSDLIGRYGALDEFGNTLDSTNTLTDKIFDFEEEEKKKKKKDNIISRFFKKKKAADAKTTTGTTTGTTGTTTGGTTGTTTGGGTTAGSSGPAGGASSGGNYSGGPTYSGMGSIGSGGNGGNGGNSNTGGGASYSNTATTGAKDGYSYGLKKGGRAGYFFGGRAGYAEGGPIYSRLGTLSSGVQSAEQQLQGINASLQKAESDLGSDSPGGGSSLAGGPSFTSNFEDANNQGPGSSLLFGGSMDQASPITAPTVPQEPGQPGGMFKDFDYSNGAIPPMNSITGGPQQGRVPGNPELAGPVISSIGGGRIPGGNKGPESFGAVANPISSIGGVDPYKNTMISGLSQDGQRFDSAQNAFDAFAEQTRKYREKSPHTRNVIGSELYQGEEGFKNFTNYFNEINNPNYTAPQLQGLQSSGGGLGSFAPGVVPSGITNLNQLPLSEAQPISEERTAALGRSTIGNGFYDLNKGLGGLL